MKTILVNLRLAVEDVEKIDEMASVGLNRQAVARMLLLAALAAVRKNGGEIGLPPVLEVSKPEKNKK